MADSTLRKSACTVSRSKIRPTYIDLPVFQALIASKVIISRYFIQRLLMYLGRYDQKLIKLKIEHNVHQLDVDIFRAFLKLPCANNLFLFAFTYLLNEDSNQLTNVNEDLFSKGNDMKLLIF